jgi:hypothetical protein
LATIVSVVRFKKGAEIYRSGNPAKAIFNIISGIVKSCSGDDPSHIVAFLFPGDVFGLSRELVRLELLHWAVAARMEGGVEAFLLDARHKDRQVAPLQKVVISFDVTQCGIVLLRDYSPIHGGSDRR